MNLQNVIDHYHSLLDDDSARQVFAQLDAGLRERGMLVGKNRDRLVCSVLRPRFVVQEQYAALIRATELIGRAIRTVGAAVIDDEAILRPYALTETERALLRIDPGYPGVSAFGRLDAFLAPDGSWCWFVESNLESPAGIAYDEAIAEIFDQTEVMGAFRRSFNAAALPVRAALHSLLLDTYRAWGGVGTPTTAIVDLPGVVTISEFEHLRDRFTVEGMPTLVATTDDLRYDGRRLYANDTPVDLLYRRVLQHEFLARYTLDHPLIRAYADHAVCVVNPFRSKPVHTKLIMWLLSDEDGPAAGLLGAEERAAAQRHVPWTRLVRTGATRYGGERVDLLEFARRNRERLVIKPNDEYGGSGVVLGWEVDQQAWERALEDGLNGPHVLQERVPVPEELYPTWAPDEGLRLTPRFVDSDPCLFGDHALGCLTRIASTALLNVSAGGGSAPPTFVVDSVR